MCGIVGYIGNRSALETVLGGLARLEYRGYDSTGVAVQAQGCHHIAKRAGKLVQLHTFLQQHPQPAGTLGIGHTRWATHGAPTDTNAHPHTDESGAVALVHNGVLENHPQLRSDLLQRGYTLTSETDTEIVAHLLGDLVNSGMSLADSMRLVCRQLHGAFTLVATHIAEPDLVVGARHDSPLVVGRGNGENFLASDVAAFVEHSRQAIELGQDQLVQLRHDSVEVTDFDGRPVNTHQYHIDWDITAVEKAGHDYFMLKEIAEQPNAVADTMRGRITDSGTLSLEELQLSHEQLRNLDKVIVVASGTSHHAGMIAKYALEQWGGLPCDVEMAHEFRYREPVLTPTTLVVAISQSGETMDTLLAARHAKDRHATVVGVCNVVGSSLPRECHGVVYTRAGPEIAVASTKAFLTQLTTVYLLALHLAQIRNPSDLNNKARGQVRQLEAMPAKLEQVLDTMEPVRKLARSLANERCVLFLGRNVDYPVALEGALKLKELAYMHAEGFAAGELKHGPIALIQDGLPVVTVVPPKETALHDKLISNIHEISTRGARPLLIAENNDDATATCADTLIPIPEAPPLLRPLITTVPLQILACELAATKGHDVDQPRNLAKSVTVE